MLCCLLIERPVNKWGLVLHDSASCRVDGNEPTRAFIAMPVEMDLDFALFARFVEHRFTKLPIKARVTALDRL